MEKRFVKLFALAALVAPFTAGAQDNKAEKRNMELVGYNDLQGRSAYQPLIHKQGGRWIAYVGHHGDNIVNPLTGKKEDNGTSIVDVTDPKKPGYLAHIPGEPGLAEAGGAQMVRVCDGATLPRADKSKVYLLRTFGNQAHEIWDVTDPAKPGLLATIVKGLKGTHKNWWECDSGIAYLVSGIEGWRVRRMTQVYDLSDPANPVFIRNFGLPGQQAGSPGEAPAHLHGPQGQPHLFRLQHEQGRGAADRRPREALERPQGADRREPALPAGRQARPAAHQRRAHHAAALAHARPRVRKGRAGRGGRFRDGRQRADRERVP